MTDNARMAMEVEEKCIHLYSFSEGYKYGTYVYSCIKCGYNFPRKFKWLIHGYLCFPEKTYTQEEIQKKYLQQIAFE